MNRSHLTSPHARSDLGTMKISQNFTNVDFQARNAYQVVYERDNSEWAKGTELVAVASRCLLLGVIWYGKGTCMETGKT